MTALGAAALIAAITFALSMLGCVVLIIHLYRNGDLATEDPKQILARRFADGSIDEGEYRQRLGVLGNGRQKLA